MKPTALVWWRVAPALCWALLGGLALLAVLGVPLGSLGEQLLILPGVLVHNAMEWVGARPGARTLLTESAHGPPFLNLLGVLAFYGIPAATAVLGDLLRRGPVAE